MGSGGSDRGGGTRRLAAHATGRGVVCLLAAIFIGSGLGGIAWYVGHDEAGAGAMVGIELTGTAEEALRSVCGPATGYGAAPDACDDEIATFRRDLGREAWLLGSTAFGLFGLCAIGGTLFSSRRARRVARTAAGLTLLSTLLGVLSIAMLGHGLAHLGEPRPSRLLWTALGAVATVKFVVLLFVTVVAVVVALVVVFRALLPAADFTWLRSWSDGGNVVPPPTVVDERGRADSPAWSRPVPLDLLGRETGEVGICVSGGGIRSATVTLGALQSLRRAGVLQRARYLVSVSGGGYMTGAFQLALQPLPEHRNADVTPETVFDDTSPEQDHVRRHGAYVADGRKEWTLALAAVLRGALASLLLIASLVVVLGVAVAVFYRMVPLAGFDYPYPFSAPPGTAAPGLPPVRHAVVGGIVLSVGLGLLGWMLLVVFAAKPHLRDVVKTFSDGFLAVALATALLGVVLPAAVWAGARAVWWLSETADLGARTVAAGGAAGTLTLAYAGSLLSILWRSSQVVGEVRRKAGSQLQQRVPTALSQRLVVWLVLLGLAVAYGVLFAAVVHTAWAEGFLTVAPAAWDRTHWAIAAAMLGFVLVALLVDQTWMSLQPFYRRRLAAAFAVRRVRRDGVEAAQPYDWMNETTTLSTYGARVEGFPQVIFAASANLSGSDRTPPGRRAASFTFSHDWVGGPAVGWVRTRDLEQALQRQRLRTLGLDLTVQNAVAVSGAAFASAMGAKATAYQTLFALSNARLGAWLPNPGWLHVRCAEGPAEGWLRPRLPRIRRITYFLRELAGVYDDRDRFLLVTDGGHYDNLGLVELLRHRCSTVFAIDSSGDAPPLAGALGEALALAREELGVVVDLDRPWALVPGGGAPLDPEGPLASLSARLSESCVVRGEIHYPERQRPDGTTDPAFTGRIVLAKTTLTGQLPYELLTYAVRNRVFPHDSTGDQWFDHGQFNAYHTLGVHLGARAAELHDQVSGARSADPPVALAPPA